MSKVFLVIALVFVVTGVLEAKRTDRKKAFSAKPTKTPKSVVDLFAGLPEDDVKFIKELDKQFKQHGDLIKIRIERDNSTAAKGTGKNSKRGLDGEIGYGYHRNHRPQSNFYFSKPKLEFYPYSQEDIPPLPHVAQQHLQQQQFQQQLHHRNRQRLNYHARPHYSHTVEIQPSPGYEIRENTFDHPPPPPQPYHADYQQPEAYHAEPVIVLKIPGPQKYAAHLRVLLQQYLELRAAQYIQELQQQEQANQHGNVVQETYVEEHIPETNGHTLATAQPGSPHEVYGPPEHQEVNYVHHEQHDAQHADGQTVYEAPQQGQAVYETHEVHYAPQQAVFINQNLYQQDPRSAYQGPAYLPAPDQPDEQQYYYQQPEQHAHHAGEELPTSENYPSEHHTRVVFTKELHQSATPTTQVEYQQEYHTPVEDVTPAGFRAQEYYQPHEMEVDDVVAITQKPYNYHVHGSSTTLSPSKSAKRDAPPYTEEQFKKLSKLVHKLKRKQGATEESN